jgi:hypothetical protein
MLMKGLKRESGERRQLVEILKGVRSATGRRAQEGRRILQEAQRSEQESGGLWKISRKAEEIAWKARRRRRAWSGSLADWRGWIADASFHPQSGPE